MVPRGIVDTDIDRASAAHGQGADFPKSSDEGAGGEHGDDDGGRVTDSVYPVCEGCVVDGNAGEEFHWVFGGGAGAVLCGGAGGEDGLREGVWEMVVMWDRRGRLEWELRYGKRRERGGTSDCVWH